MFQLGRLLLMTEKSEELYTAVLSAVHSFNPDFNPSMAVCGLKRLPAVPSRLYFPIQQSLVSFSQAVYHKVKELGLCKLYKINSEFKKWIHQLLSLPF